VVFDGLPEQAEAKRLLDAIPAISPAMIGRVQEEMRQQGPASMLYGPPQGTPYKIYAVESGRLGMPLAGLLAITVPARLLRFALAAAVAAACARWALASWTPGRRLLLHALCWGLFYCWYLSAMPW